MCSAISSLYFNIRHSAGSSGGSDDALVPPAEYGIDPELFAILSGSSDSGTVDKNGVAIPYKYSHYFEVSVEQIPR